MENKRVNIENIRQVAEGLKELNERMIYIGGAVVSLYADDKAADEVRPTADLDMTINVVSYYEWSKLQERLSELKFYPDHRDKVICRYRYGESIVDIMPAHNLHMGPTNRWYEPGFRNFQIIDLNTTKIKILTLPYFLATKFEAFNDRSRDYRFSHDFEDIVYVIDNNIGIVDAVTVADLEVKTFVVAQLQILRMKSNFEECILAHLSPIISDGRLPIIIAKIDAILSTKSMN